MPKKIIFLDRDGVINKEVNYLHKIDDFEFIDGTFDACEYFHKLGYEIIIISNQSGINRGFYSLNDYMILTKWMLNQFAYNKISILDSFFCPHGPESSCKCRKPKPGMLLDAQIKHNIDMTKSWMIGDKEDDIIAANAAGINNTILVESGHKNNNENSNAKFFLHSISESHKIISS